MKRALFALAAVLAASVVAWGIAVKVESPTQAAARAVPPAPVPIVVPLDQGYLQGPVSVSATAQRERQVQVFRPSASAEVVTAVETVVGDVLHPGSVVLRSNGRPVFALPGSFPMYRDLQNGDEGDDVAQLQQGLVAAGFTVGGDRSGRFGKGTESALRRMYKAAGYSTPSVSVAVPGSTASAGGTIDGATGTKGASSVEQNSVAQGSGPRALLSELVIVPSLPAVVEAVASVGSRLDPETALCTVGLGDIVLSATLPTSATAVLSVGASGVFTDTDGAQGTAVVKSVNPAGSPDQSTVTMTASGAVESGTAYLVQINNPSAESSERLLAPVAAVVTRSGRSYVYRRDGETFVQVEVQVVGSAGGVAAIRPVDPADAEALTPGVEVRVGDS